MSPEEYREYFLANQESYAAWGDCVVDSITKDLDTSLGDRAREFIKIPVVPRVKDLSSALGKIARKGYEDPVSRMTDVVGCRFVILLKNELELICNAIEKQGLWTASRDRHFEEEIKENPQLFDYQSLHYIVRAAADIDYMGVKISAGTPCEIQVRTLLQHAYAELTHDNLYKPNQAVPDHAKRYVARSMALMETTDELFCNTLDALSEANAPTGKWFNWASVKYTEVVGESFDEIDKKFNVDLISTYADLLEDVSQYDIDHFIEERKAIISSRVATRAAKSFFFRQPAILLLYFLATKKDTRTKSIWPYGSLRREMRQVFSDMGISTGDFVA